MSSFHQERVAAPTAPMQRIWSGYVSTPPVDANDTLKLVIPDMHPNLVVECKHWGGAIPDVDDSVLVIFDNNREPWVLSTWSTNSSGIGVAPSGPAGGDLSGSYPNPVVERSTASAFKFGSFGDVTLYRFAAKDLRSESDLSLLASDTGRLLLAANGGWPYITLRSPDPAAMTNIGSGIAFQRGPGGGPTDWEFYTKPNSGGLLVWSQQQQLDMFRFSNDGFWFGPTFDTKLYRNGTSQLRTDGQMWAGMFLSLIPNTGSWGFAQYLAGDSQPRLYTDYNGKLNWGSGSSAIDTNLYRNSAAVLQTDGAFVSGGNTSKRIEFSVDRIGGGQAALNFGGPTPDTNLYRSAAGVLKTDGQLIVTGNPSGTLPVGLMLGSPFGLPTYLQGQAGSGYNFSIGHNAWLRASDGVYLWDTTHGSFGSRVISMNFTTGIDFFADAAAATAGAVISSLPLRFRIGNDGKLYIGGTDVTLYRSGASSLRTDTNFIVGGGYIWNTTDGVPGRIAFGSAADTYLYRAGAAQLRTDGSFYANTTSGYFGIIQPGDSSARLTMRYDGYLMWSPGTRRQMYGSTA